MSIFSFFLANKNADFRLQRAQKHISVSVIIKIISILLSLILVPLIINLVDGVRYGIWITMSSIVYWFNFFDFGLSNGFRNKYAECKAKSEVVLLRSYVSTTYLILFGIFAVIFSLAIFIGNFINWSTLLNLDQILNNELRLIFIILIGCLCLRVPLNTIQSLLMADQKPAIASLLTLFGQMLTLLFIFWFKIQSIDSLPYVTLATAGAPCLVLIVSTWYLFFKKYHFCRPSIQKVNLKLFNDIFALGGKFFILQILMIFIYQFVNIIITRFCGPMAVTQYNIVYKYFNILSTFMIIVLSSFWSPCTEAYINGELGWIKNIYKKLKYIWLILIVVCAIMLLLSSFVYEVWVGTINIPFRLSFAMAIYTIIYSLASIPEYVINGVGKLNIQVLLYVVYAIISIPLMIFFVTYIGVDGVLIVLSGISIVSYLIMDKQLYKLLNGKARGIWNT